MNDKTELEEYQEWVKQTTYGDMRGVELLIMANALAGEVGETCNVVKKYYRDGNDLPVDALRSELGDVIWYVAAICNATGLTLDEVIENNISKINERTYVRLGSEI